jgi:hypothetical protein
MREPKLKKQAAEWLAMSDDELIHRIETLGKKHGQDEVLLEIIGSNRHFFVRQIAAKKIEASKLLHEHWDDRHIGQILVRGLSRLDDLAYLEDLQRNSRFLDVRKSADAQIKIIRQKLKLGE